MALPAFKIDTLEIAKELEESGIPKVQAEAQTRVYMRVIDTFAEESLVTKKDLQATEKNINERFDTVNEHIDTVEKNFTDKIQSVKEDLVDAEKRLTERINATDKSIVELRNEVKTLSLKMTIKLGSLMVIALTALSIIMKLL